MKKLLTAFMAFMTIMCLASCVKDGPTTKRLYRDSAVIEGVTYGTTITSIGDEFYWENTNKTDDVTHVYKFTYERKSDLQKDFAELADGVDKFDETLLPAFTKTFRYINDEVQDVVVYREVSGGTVLVRFVVGSKSFSLPYAFIIGANNAIKP